MNSENGSAAPAAPDHDPDRTGRAGHGRIITALAELPSNTLLDERALAGALGVTKRTVRRMVIRTELPPPISFAGRATWMAEHILRHLAARAERAARLAEQEARRLDAVAASAGRRPLRARREETGPHGTKQ